MRYGAIALAVTTLLAAPAAAQDSYAPDGAVEGLNAPVYTVLQQVRARNTGALTPADAAALLAAIRQDGTIDPGERDLLGELTQTDVRTIFIRREGAAPDAPRGTAFPAAGDTRRVLLAALNPELDAIWAKPKHGWPELVARAGEDYAAREHVLGYIQTKLGEKWAESTLENRYQPFRDLLGELDSDIFGNTAADQAAARKLLHEAAKGVDVEAHDNVPDYLYNWIAPDG